jgi:hypothetical protein
MLLANSHVIKSLAMISKDRFLSLFSGNAGSESISIANAITSMFSSFGSQCRDILLAVIAQER